MWAFTVHIPDVTDGEDENGDYPYAVCGQRVLLSDSHHYYGMASQVNCKDCLEVSDAIGGSQTQAQAGSS